MKKSLLIFLFIICILTLVKAQDVPVTSSADSAKTQDVQAASPVDTIKTQEAGITASSDVKEVRKNLIKFNITAALIKTTRFSMRGFLHELSLQHLV
jgi:hypothetical protein